MKKLIAITMAVILLAMVAGCGSGDNPSQKQGADSKLEAEVLEILQNETFDFLCRYHEISSRTGEPKEIGGVAWEENLSFSGEFTEISDLQCNKYENEIWVSFTGHAQGDGYMTEPNSSFHIVFLEDEDGKPIVQPDHVVNEQEAILPFVVPVYPFDTDYIYEKGGTISCQIPKNLVDKSYDESYLFDGATIDEMQYLNYGLIISFPINRETVTDIQLLPTSEDDVAIQQTPFSYKTLVELTLSNGKKIESTTIDIKYYPDDSNKFPSDYWSVNLPTGPQSWSVME